MFEELERLLPNKPGTIEPLDMLRGKTILYAEKIHRNYCDNEYRITFTDSSKLIICFEDYEGSVELKTYNSQEL